MAQIEKPWSEQVLLAKMKKGELHLPPVTLHLIQSQLIDSSASCPDGVVDVEWQDRRSRFVFEYKPLSTPMSVDTAIAHALRHAHDTNLLPMIIVPFLSEEKLRQLEVAKVSGIDLSGNGVIIAPDFAVWRSGQQNLFRDSQPIKNIYRGNSSIFARCFLLQREFSSLSSLRKYAISRLNTEESAEPDVSRLTQGTASKVVQALEQELIVAREANSLRLVDAQTLLTRLQTNFRPSNGRRLEGKTPFKLEGVWERLQHLSASTILRSVATGLGSATHYGVLSGTEKISFYVSSLDVASNFLEIKPTRVFPNIEIIEEQADLVYFDARRQESENWASPIQTWIELASGQPRERTAAQELAQHLLQGRTEELV